MRVTPNTIVRPDAMMNRAEAVARPDKACRMRNDASMRGAASLPRGRPRTGPAGGRRSVLAHRPHFGFGEDVVGAVDVTPVLHRRRLAGERGLADPRAERRLMV